ncbi:MAG: hypothetical protein A3E87_02420 [Gammaproteobacteria bacterium RIFCSPHIGHO2_12_FULL_35_23]|nr:MAG: hypothetical protein A3E87_02420 [Gammaproteobacteria bacterium RIFCSPHIGHO2_12_FULL_35_23]
MKQQSKRNIIACIIGNIIEWYEFTLFAYLAPVIAVLFFPNENKWLGLLSTFLIFAAGFIVRPLGSILLGHLGDRLSRAKTLKLTILLISLCSIFTGLLPTYQQVGMMATLLLILCRLLQGLCIGGEFAGAMIYLVESAPAERRARVSAMTNNGSNFGVLLAIGSCAILSSGMSNIDFVKYGWRLLFILGGILGMLGLWLRRDITESEVFIALKRKITEKYLPIKYVFKYQFAVMVKIGLLLVISACGSYVLMGYLSTYLHVFLQIPLAKAYQLQTIFIVLSLLCVPIFARLSDRYGRKSILLFSTLGYLIFSLPVFYLLQQTQVWWLLLPLVIFYSAEQAVMPATIVEMFPGKGRYTGVSIAYNCTMALVGGTSALTNTWLIAYFNNKLFIAYYVMFCAFISLLIAVFFLSSHYGVKQDLEAILYETG